jgi:hypothetical protein
MAIINSRPLKASASSETEGYEASNQSEDFVGELFHGDPPLRKLDLFRLLFLERIIRGQRRPVKIYTGSIDRAKTAFWTRFSSPGHL